MMWPDCIPIVLLFFPFVSSLFFFLQHFRSQEVSAKFGYTNKCYKVNDDTTVEKLKHMIAEEEIIGVESIVLIYNEKRLDDQTTIKELDLDDPTAQFVARVVSRWVNILFTFTFIHWACIHLIDFTTKYGSLYNLLNSLKCVAFYPWNKF